MSNADTLVFNKPNNDIRYYTKADIDKKMTEHTHDDRYYTETEINDKLSKYLALSGGTITGNISTDKGATFCTDGNIYLKAYNDWLTNILNGKAPSNHTHSYIPTNASCNKNWNWSGQGGQPTWLWGGEDGTNMYVYNPSNFTVYRCTGGINKGSYGVGISQEANYFRTYTNSGSPADNVMDNGSSNARWKQVYAIKSSINTSDKNQKNSIMNIDPRILQLLLNADPKQYKFNGGDRIHTGLIAQEIEEEMNKLGLTAIDVAALCKDALREYKDDSDTDEDTDDNIVRDKDGNIIYRYGLRYEEFIGPILQLVQILWKAVFGDADISQILSDKEG